jgi:hypothetical protein
MNFPAARLSCLLLSGWDIRERRRNADLISLGVESEVTSKISHGSNTLIVPILESVITIIELYIVYQRPTITINWNKNPIDIYFYLKVSFFGCTRS